MWKRAVWQEDLQEEEGVIPSNWIENKTVYWPPGTKALNAMKARQNPEKNWLKFPLIKVKFSSGSIIKDLNEVSMHLTSSSSSIKSREPKLDMYGKNLNSPCQKFFQEDISSLFAQDIEFQKRVLYLLTDIRSELQNPNRVTESASNSEFISQIKFISTDMELTEADKALNDEKVRSLWVNQLQLIGGTSLKDRIHKIMLRIFSNNFMTSRNMKGKGGKICFKNTNLYGVVKASAIKYDGATETLINGILSDFLKYAPFRKGGGKEKKIV